MLGLWMSTICYTAYDCVQASHAEPLRRRLQASELEMGVSYLAIGAARAVGGYTKWQILEMNYRVAAEQVGFTIKSLRRRRHRASN